MITWNESDIEDYVVDNPSIFGSRFRLIGRQVNIGYGIIDVLLLDLRKRHLVVVEIKNKPICNHALSQIMRYIVGVEDYCRALGDSASGEVFGVRGILLGPDINDETTSALRYVQPYIRFYKVSVRIGINAEVCEFVRNEDSDSYKPDKFSDVISRVSAYYKDEEGEVSGGIPEHTD